MILATQFRRIATVKTEDRMWTLIVLCTSEIKKVSLNKYICFFTILNVKSKNCKEYNIWFCTSEKVPIMWNTYSTYMSLLETEHYTQQKPQKKTTCTENGVARRTVVRTVACCSTNTTSPVYPVQRHRLNHLHCGNNYAHSRPKMSRVARIAGDTVRLL